MLQKLRIKCVLNLFLIELELDFYKSLKQLYFSAGSLCAENKPLRVFSFTAVCSLAISIEADALSLNNNNPNGALKICP